LSQSVSSLISNIYYVFEHTAIVPQFLSGIGAIFILGGKRMSKYQTINHQQLELLEREVPAKQPAKRINIVSLKLGNGACHRPMTDKENQ
jgi:hypothetical protein